MASPTRSPALVSADHATLVTGQIYNWDGYGTGELVNGGGYYTVTREVTTIAKADGAAGRVHAPGSDPLTVSLHAARAVIAGALLTPGCAAFELRYVTTGTSGPDPGRIRMFLTTKTLGSSDLAAAACRRAADSACNGLPPGWGTQAVARPGLDGSSRGTILELRVPEEVTYPQWQHVRADYFYTVHSVRGDGTGWRSFWQTLAHQGEPVNVSILFRRADLSAPEKETLGNITSQLQYVAETREDYNSIGTPYVAPADENAIRALNAWRGRVDAMRDTVLARLAVRARPDIAAQVAGALAAAVSSSRDVSTEPHALNVEVPLNSADLQAARFSFDNLEILPWGGHSIWKTSQAPWTLRRLPYLLGLNEAAALSIIPVPDEAGAPGFETSRVVDHVRAPIGGTGSWPSSGLRVGDLLHQGKTHQPATLPLSAVNRHILVSGASGSGKTTTVMTLLVQLWRDHQVPFLVIESVKNEYRALLETPGLEDLVVITAGVDDVSPLRLNPLAPPPGVRCETHLVSVLNALKLALPLDQPLPLLLEETLERTYVAAGWDFEDTTDTAPPAPTLRDLLHTFSIVFDEKGYVGEARNIGPATELRLRTLLRGAKGRTFDVLDVPKELGFAALLRRPVVIELDAVTDPDEKAMYAALVLDRVQAEARRRGASGNKLQHVTVIEEAHRILPATGTNTAGSGAGGHHDPRAATVAAYTDALAELRGWGEGFIVCSQSPERLAPSAVALTGTRIVHHLDNARDRRALLDDIGATGTDDEVAARLRNGEAIARWPGIDEPVVLTVNPDPNVDTSATLPDDQLAARLAGTAQQVRALLPFRTCSSSVCTAGCDQAVRRVGARIASQIASPARRRWEAGGADPTSDIVGLAHTHGTRGVQDTYCVAAHLVADQIAFHSPPGAEDTRPHLEAAIRKEFPDA